MNKEIQQRQKEVDKRNGEKIQAYNNHLAWIMELVENDLPIHSCSRDDSDGISKYRVEINNNTPSHEEKLIFVITYRLNYTMSYSAIYGYPEIQLYGSPRGFRRPKMGKNKNIDNKLIRAITEVIENPTSSYQN